jgi:serine/threonine protein kinase/septal ring-binding cell division protein DamX
MLCAKCGTNNGDGRSFCGHCGAVLELRCPECAAPNSAGERFCGVCGRALGDAIAPHPPDRPPPESIAGGRYRIVRMLGQGASKVVYLAHDEMLDRDVAVALFRVEGLDDAGRARIVREARAMGRLGDHPNIVGIYDIGQTDKGRPFIVSQYVPGGSLDALLKRSPGRRLDVAEAVRIGQELCRGIEHAHALGIIHRDIKPANVFLTSDGAPLLGDFGLALAPDQSHITAKGMMIGTAAYMPPEQALGRPLEPRSDLYSLGAMLYEMLTGRPPFVGDDLLAVVSQHVNKMPDPPSKFVPEIPAALDALVLKLLEKDPAGRPADAKTVGETLQTIAGESRGAMDRLASSVMVERPNLIGHTAPDGTVSIMFSDIENSTLMIDRLGDLRAQELFRMHNALIRDQLARHGGYEVKSMGDGFMVAFSSARRALMCAIEIQRRLADYSIRHPDAPLRVRIGLNVGEAIREAGDFFGKTVVMAARIGAAARGGEILVSSTFKAITDSAGDIRFDDGRDMTLKGLSGSYRVYRVLWASERKTCPVCAKPIPVTSSTCPECAGKVMELKSSETEPSPANLAATAGELPLRTLEDSTLSRPIEIRKEASGWESAEGLLRSMSSGPARSIAVVGGAAILLLAVFILRARPMRRSLAARRAPRTAANAPQLPAEHGAMNRPVAGASLAPAERLRPAPRRKAALAPEAPRAPTLRSKTTVIPSAADSAFEPPAAGDVSSVTPQCVPTPHRYNVQVDAVSDKAAADEMLRRIASLGFKACEKTITVKGEKQYAVRIGPYATADEAAAAQEKLHEQYKAAFSDPDS